MVTNALVNLPAEAREFGWKLLDRLTARQLPVDALFWGEFDEGDWRLYLSTPRATTDGPLQVYDVVRQAIEEIPDEERGGLGLYDVAVSTPDSIRVQEIRRRYGPVLPERNRIRRTSLTSGEAYVYKMTG